MTNGVSMKVKRKYPDLFNKMLEIQESLKRRGGFYIDGKTVEERYLKYCELVNYAVYIEYEYGKKTNLKEIEKKIDFLHKKVVY